MSANVNKGDNLDDIYSDFSEQDERPARQFQYQKKLSSQQDNLQGGYANKGQSVPNNQPVKPQSQIILIGGHKFLPPPPPPMPNKPAKLSYAPQQAINPKVQMNVGHGSGQGNGQHLQRQRKSTIFIKNIPKSCNKQQTLTKFFRTYGNIKSIKTSEQQSSAMVRFQKQQDAYRFMQSKPLILNRSYIKYNTSQDFTVPVQCIAEKQKDEVVIVNANQKQMIILKQSSENLIADKYRCMLFLMKNKDSLTNEQCVEVEREMMKCRKIREMDANDKELGEVLMSFQNQYDWTLSYKVKTKQPIEKKKITITKKYGPIGSIAIKLLSSTVPQQQANQDDQDKIVLVRIKHLALSSCWNMFLENYQTLDLEIQGYKLFNIFKAWFVQKIMESQIQSEQPNPLNETQNINQVQDIPTEKKEEKAQDKSEEKKEEKKQEKKQEQPKQSQAAEAFVATQQKDEQFEAQNIEEANKKQQEQYCAKKAEAKEKSYIQQKERHKDKEQ